MGENGRGRGKKRRRENGRTKRPLCRRRTCAHPTLAVSFAPCVPVSSTLFSFFFFVSCFYPFLLILLSGGAERAGVLQRARRPPPGSARSVGWWWCGFGGTVLAGRSEEGASRDAVNAPGTGAQSASNRTWRRTLKRTRDGSVWRSLRPPLAQAAFSSFLFKLPPAAAGSFSKSSPVRSREATKPPRAASAKLVTRRSSREENEMWEAGRADGGGGGETNGRCVNEGTWIGRFHAVFMLAHLQTSPIPFACNS